MIMIIIIIVAEKAEAERLGCPPPSTASSALHAHDHDPNGGGLIPQINTIIMIRPVVHERWLVRWPWLGLPGRGAWGLRFHPALTS